MKELKFKEVDKKTEKQFAETVLSGSPNELLKFDMLDSEFEKNITNKLLDRGFSDKQVLNNRGLIGATIDETVNEVKKCYESANSENKETKLFGLQLPPNCNFIPREGIDVWNEEEFFKRNGI